MLIFDRCSAAPDSGRLLHARQVITVAQARSGRHVSSTSSTVSAR